MIVSSIPEFVDISSSRRLKRLKEIQFDSRSVLYGEPMIRFFVESIHSFQDFPERESVSAIHARWLTTPREELYGKTPREVLHEKRDQIDFDLHSRSLQYSFTKDCPPDLSSDSLAYKFAGYGTHEIVVYYDLIRFLLESFQTWLKEDGKSTVETEIKRLSILRDQWLREPNSEYSGRTPNAILESERKRRNLTMSAEESIIDDDCPICVEMSQIFDTPMFWHLDGCNMDDHFAFSFHDTVEQWEQEKAEWESFRTEEMKKDILGERKQKIIGDDPEDFISLMRGDIPW
jgi:hypothetical protein